MVERSNEFILTALFLSRCGQKREDGASLPPRQLRTESWAAAYAAFYDQLADGRSLRSFHNSLKASRDQFDSHVDSGRRGWRDGDNPKPLPDRDAEILSEWEDRPCEELWEAVAPFADPDVATVPPSVLRDLRAGTDEDEEQVSYGLEGKSKAVVSKVRERSPKLRAAALRIHGYACQVCGFRFEDEYGDWGKDFAEVHHLKELSRVDESGTEVDPSDDLAVLCSNCHRMIHRKPQKAISLEELREIRATAREGPD